jgi:hypothetical protein
MKNISTGAGLAIVGLGIALHPVLSNVLAASPSANAAPPASLVASAVAAQAGPTVVWMGVTHNVNTNTRCYDRMWSDGRIEVRSVSGGYPEVGCSFYEFIPHPCASDNPWREVPPPTGGNGFACRADMNGDRLVDGADLGIMLNAWGQQGGCEPDATYPCLNLGNLAGAVAAK